MSPTQLSSRSLNEEARYHLRALYRRYFDTMHFEIGDQYSRLIEEYFNTDTTIKILWAGNATLENGTDQFVHIAFGDLLLEINVDNQWSTQNIAVPSANHLHSMFRDLSFGWSGGIGQ